MSNRIIENLHLGNPGIGGTEYAFFNMVIALSKRQDFEIVFFLTAKQDVRYDICIELIRDVYEAVEKAKYDNYQLLVVRNNQNQKFYKMVDENRMPVIVWAHNYNQKELLWIRRSLYTKRYVCVSRAQLESNWKLCPHKKSMYIYLGIADSQIAQKPVLKKGTYVVCQGALERQKGFHILAKIWPMIHKRVPDAELHIIGSGKLYDDFSVMGGVWTCGGQL